jgi:hypothetical protein
MRDILEEIDALSAKTIDEDEDWMEMAHVSYTLLMKARAEIAALREARDVLARETHEHAWTVADDPTERYCTECGFRDVNPAAPEPDAPASAAAQRETRALQET